MQIKQTLYIDNMVCNRCKTAVHRIVENLGWRVERIELGRFTGWPPESRDDVLPVLAQQLETIGFRLRDDAGGVISRIKGLIIDYVYNDVASSAAPLSERISNDIGQSYSHLSRLFSKEEGRTIADFYRIQRMERGKQLLVSTDEQISLIAYRLHYGSLGRFTSAFKESTGMSPSAFRERGVHMPVPLDEL
ncbi:helix-turn-helix transcriptional regulator [Lewinella sp. JB7]|uniref:helix-turn-helix transcriptional regulator n=1 Tax=Lewinella sp. JB7 TaxID=2962887 RepID=UPI0020C95AE8|nr:helix-turn-helix transcriptional regulator [Lewinella sp. JB7]MCP9236327.1 helix-turn-helix transcriptional regulator [Lewinella sp. JB7]